MSVSDLVFSFSGFLPCFHYPSTLHCVVCTCIFPCGNWGARTHLGVALTGDNQNSLSLPLHLVYYLKSSDVLNRHCFSPLLHNVPIVTYVHNISNV